VQTAQAGKDHPVRLNEKDQGSLGGGMPRSFCTARDKPDRRISIQTWQEGSTVYLPPINL
jgi:hypothetical protein